MNTMNIKLESNQRIVKGHSFIMEGNVVVATIEEGLPPLPLKFKYNEKRLSTNLIDRKIEDCKNWKELETRVMVMKKKEKNLKKYTEMIRQQLNSLETMCKMCYDQKCAMKKWTNMDKETERLWENQHKYIKKNHTKLEESFINKKGDLLRIVEALPYYEHYYAKIKRDYPELPMEECPICMECKELVNNTNTDGEKMCNHSVCLECMVGMAMVVGRKHDLKCPVCREGFGNHTKNEIWELRDKKKKELRTQGNAMANMGGDIPNQGRGNRPINAVYDTNINAYV